MAQFKASLPVFAPIKSETDSAITYENGAFVGKMVKTEVKPNKVEGSLYADDALAEYETEFKDADITLETSTIPVEVFVSMFGETKTEGTGSTTPKPVVLTSKAGDAPVYGGYGFVSVEVVDGVRKYLTYVVQCVWWVGKDEVNSRSRVRHTPPKATTSPLTPRRSRARL